MSENGGVFTIDAQWIGKLYQAMKEYPGHAEASINYVFHKEAGRMIQKSIKNLMPVSGIDWKGKKPAAKNSKSLRNVNSDLAVTVKTTPDYHYLYFPDDGSNTVFHVGDQRFFERGAEAVQGAIVQRCIDVLIETFDEGV